MHACMHMGLLLRAASAVGSSKLSGLAAGSWRVYPREFSRHSGTTAMTAVFIRIKSTNYKHSHMEADTSASGSIGSLASQRDTPIGASTATRANDLCHRCLGA
jgi:hypothetical protein